MQKYVISLFETLYFLQKSTFYKKFYYFSRILISLIIIQLIVTTDTGWTINDGFSAFLLWITFPVDRFPFGWYTVFFAFCVGLMGLTTALLLQVAMKTHAGTRVPPNIVKILRFSFGLITTFMDPILTCFLASLDCNWFQEQTNMSLKSSVNNCGMTVYRIIYLVLSGLCIFPFLFIVIFSNIMHINDPKSCMIVSRAHARLDVLQTVSVVIMATIFAFFTDYNGALAGIYLFFQILMMVCLIVFQPYYHAFTNDLFTSFAAVTVYFGILFVAWLYTGADEAIKIAVFVGFVPFGLLGFFASAMFRQWYVNKALKDVSRRDRPPLPDDFYQIIRTAYDRNITTPMWVDMQAAMVEVKTRFLQNMKAGDNKMIDAAEYILKDGLLKFPQSGYLRLQLISFFLAYKPATFNLAHVKLEEFSSYVVFDLDFQFSIIRKRRELERVRQSTELGGASTAMDSISFEELKKKIRDAREGHEKAIELSAEIWSILFRKLGGASKEYKHKMKRNKFGGFDDKKQQRKDKKMAAITNGSSKNKKKNKVFPSNGLDDAYNGVFPASNWDEESDIGVAKAKEAAAAVAKQRSKKHEGATSDDDDASSNGIKENSMLLAADPRFVSNRWSPMVSQQEIRGALDTIAPLLEQVQNLTSQTAKEYETLMVQCGDSREVMLDYARFLRNIKKDYFAADELEDRANAMSNELKEEKLGRDDVGSVAKSSMSGASSTALSVDTHQRNKQQRMIQREASRVDILKTRLRIITFIIAVSCSISFGTFFGILSTAAADTFFSGNESGLRRSGCITAAYDLRTMHLAALNNDSATFNAVATSLNENINTYQDLHFNLMFTYTTSYVPLLTFMTDQSIPVSSVGDGTTFKTMFMSADELFNRMMDLCQIALAKPMNKFRGFQMYNPASFPEYYFVLANAHQCIESLDTATSMYRNQNDWNTYVVEYVVEAMCVLVVVVELFAVLAVFRPIVAKMFAEFWLSMSRYSDVPLPVLSHLCQTSRMQLRKIRVITGKDGGDQDVDNDNMKLLSPDDDNTSREGGTRMSVQSIPYPVAASSMNGKGKGQSLKKLQMQMEDDLISKTEEVLAQLKSQKEPRSSSSRIERSASPDVSSVQKSALRSEAKLLSNTESAPRRVSMQLKHVEIPVNISEFESRPLTMDDADDLDVPATTKAKSPVEIKGMSKSPVVPNGALNGTKKVVIRPTFADLPASTKKDEAPLPSSSSSSESSSEGEEESGFEGETPRSDFEGETPRNEKDDDRESKSSTASLDEFGEKKKKKSKKEARKKHRKHGNKKGSNKRQRRRGPTPWEKLLILFNKIVTFLTRTEDQQTDNQTKITRKTLIVLVYCLLLVLIWVCIIAFSAVATSGMADVRHSSAEINTSGRRRSIFDTATFWSREVFYAPTPGYSLISPLNNVTEYSSETAARCMLSTMAAIGQMIHNALLYDQDYGMFQLPITRGLGTNLMESPCSVLTHDPFLIDSSTHVPGFSNKGEFTDFYYSSVCLTTNDFEPNSPAATSPRLIPYTNKMSDAACQLFNQKVPIASVGMHRFYDEVMGRLFTLGSAPYGPAFTAEFQALQVFKTTTDMSVGLLKALLMVQSDTLVGLDDTNKTMAIFYAVVLLFVFLQYAVLGKRIEALMNSNLEILLTSDRMIGDAVVKMRKEGYDTSILEELTEEIDEVGEADE